MEEWFDLGTHLVCTTCLGTKISGNLAAYDIAQKYMILRKITAAEHNNTINNGEGGGGMETSGTEKKAGTSNFILVNLNFISAVDEIAATNNADVDQKEIRPPTRLDLKKLKEKLEASKIEKMNRAKLGNLGVTPNGIAIFEKLLVTLGSQSDTVRWNDQGQIEIFGEVVISTPFEPQSLTMKKSGTGNKQTLEHVRKIVIKYYEERKIQDQQLFENTNTKPQLNGHITGRKEQHAVETQAVQNSPVWSSKVK